MKINRQFNWEIQKDQSFRDLQRRLKKKGLRACLEDSDWNHCLHLEVVGNRLEIELVPESRRLDVFRVLRYPLGRLPESRLPVSFVEGAGNLVKFCESLHNHTFADATRNHYLDRIQPFQRCGNEAHFSYLVNLEYDERCAPAHPICATFQVAFWGKSLPPIIRTSSLGGYRVDKVRFQKAKKAFAHVLTLAG